MNIRSTIIAWAVALLTAVAAIVFAGGSSGSAGARSAARALIPEARFPLEQATAIHLARAGEPPLVFQRDGNQWRQVEPFEFPMDAYSIGQLIQLARQLEVSEQIEPADLGEDLPLAALGLDPPAATLIYNAGDRSMMLRLGRRGIAGRAYLQIDDAPTIHVVGSALHERAVSMDHREWRDRRIFLLAGIDSTRVSRTMLAQGVESAMNLERLENNWRMTVPVQTDLDGSARDEFFAALGRAQCGGFIRDEPHDLARFGLQTPVAVFEVQTPRTREVGGSLVRDVVTERLLVGSRIGAGNADRSAMIEGRPVVFRLPEAAVRAFFVQPRHMVRLTACGVSPGVVKSMQIVGPDGEFRIERDLERWVEKQSRREVPAQLAEELLANLTQVRSPFAAQFGPYPRELQVGRVDLYGYDPRPMTSVLIAFDPESEVWLLENGENVQRLFKAPLGNLLSPANYGLPGSSE